MVGRNSMSLPAQGLRAPCMQFLCLGKPACNLRLPMACRAQPSCEMARFTAECKDRFSAGRAIGTCIHTPVWADELPHETDRASVIRTMLKWRTSASAAYRGHSPASGQNPNARSHAENNTKDAQAKGREKSKAL